MPLDASAIEQAVQGFHAEHERTYGYHSPQEATQIVNVRLRVRARASEAIEVRADHIKPAVRRRAGDPVRDRQVYFGRRWGWQDTPVVRRDTLVASTGPLVIEEYDTTIVVPPGALVRRDATGSVHVDLRPLL